MKYLVVGDVITDVFIECGRASIAQEGTFLCGNHESETTLQGGAALVFQNLCNLIDQNSQAVLIANEGIQAKKVRYIHDGRILFRYDHLEYMHFWKAAQDRVEKDITKKATQYDMVIIADYGKGAVSQKVLDACAGAKHVILDPHPSRIPYSARITTYLPNRHEWDHHPVSDAETVLVTMDKEGLLEPATKNRWPSKNERPQTVIGAGGAFAAAFAVGENHYNDLDSKISTALSYVAKAMRNKYHATCSKEAGESFRLTYFP
jgi:bifunctional ADP-heptose synthase (sugar kinase/adenylyltransferase)